LDADEANCRCDGGPGPCGAVSREIAEILRMPDVAKRLTQLGYTPVGSTPAETAAFITKDSEYWREVIDAVGMTKSK